MMSIEGRFFPLKPQLITGYVLETSLDGWQRYTTKKAPILKRQPNPTLWGFLEKDLQNVAAQTTSSTALKALFDALYIPSQLTGSAGWAELFIMVWHELARCQGPWSGLRSQDFFNPMFKERTVSNGGTICAEISQIDPDLSDIILRDSPGGEVRIEYARSDDGWVWTTFSGDGRELSYGQEICVMTKDLKAGELAYPVSIYDMLREPRTFQIFPYDSRGNLELSNGYLWWPRE